MPIVPTVIRQVKYAILKEPMVGLNVLILQFYFLTRQRYETSRIPRLNYDFHVFPVTTLDHTSL